MFHYMYLPMGTSFTIIVIYALWYCIIRIETCKLVKIVTREEWGAKAALENDTMALPVQHIFIHHTASLTCNDMESCSRVVKGIQNYHMDNLKWDDIGYNFLIGGDGRVYEGRKWARVGAHTYGFNRISIAFALLGNYVDKLPNHSMLTATRLMIKCAYQGNYVTKNAKVHGHRDGTCTECPGQALYDYISKWPDFEKGPLPGYNC